MTAPVLGAVTRRTTVAVCHKSLSDVATGFIGKSRSASSAFKTDDPGLPLLSK